MKRRDIVITLILTALAPLVWGSTYIVTTELLPAHRPLMASLIRALPAGVVLVLWARVLPNKQWLARLALLGFLNIGFFFYCLFFAATYLPGGVAALIMSLQPVLVMLLGVLVLRHRLGKHQLVAGVLGIGGIALLVLNEQSRLDPLGIIVGLLGTLSMAFGVVLTKRWGRPQTLSLLGFTGWQLLFGGLMLLPVALWLEGFPAHLEVRNYVGYSYLSVIASMIGYSLWFRGIEKLPVVSVSFLGFLSPVSAVLLGYIFLGQSLHGAQFGGILVIFLSIMLSVRKQASAGDRRQKRQKTTSTIMRSRGEMGTH